MADGAKYAQLQTFTLAGSGVSAGNSTMTLNSFDQIDGTALTMSNFGTQGFGTLEPGSGINEEQIAFTGITSNGDGTVTLTGVTTVLNVSPYTQTANFASGHAGGTSFVISNTAGFYNNFANKINDETITGTWLIIDPTAPTQIANKEYVDNIAILGSPAATPTVPGIAMVANANDILTGNDTRNYLGSPYSVFVIPSQLRQTIKFGGTGGDGALAITSGTTTINLAGASVLIMNYTSISITGTGKLAFSNPHTNGTEIILKSQGPVTLTSSNTPIIDASGMGAAAGAGGANNANGVAGNNPNFVLDVLTHGGGRGKSTGAADAAGVIFTSSGIIPYTNNSNLTLFRKVINIVPGAGGGGGAGGGTGGTGSSSGGAGGRGGGALYIECAGALNFTAVGGISVAGKDGSAGGDSGGTNAGAGGGGGGAAGMCLVLYNILTAGTGTIITAGGAGGQGGAGAGAGTGGGGGSGAGAFGGAGGLGQPQQTAGLAAGGSSAGGGGGGGSQDGSHAAGGTAGVTDGGLLTLNVDFA